ncbi:MAG: lasso RiPP family leader peptide-containing protein [Blastocatellia bacterium]
MQNANVGVSKKPYNPPRLVIHGTVKDLTQRRGRRGNIDGGGRRRPRTGG